MRDKFYFIKVWGGVEPSIEGPWSSPEERDMWCAAEWLNGESENDYFRLEVDCNGLPQIDSYAGEELEDIVDDHQANPVFIEASSKKGGGNAN